VIENVDYLTRRNSLFVSPYVNVNYIETIEH
jgi:hypothetical protein